MEKEVLQALIGDQFQGSFSLKEKRPGLFQFASSIFHEDGDAFEIFLVPQDDKSILVSDFGMTLMRLSYTYDIGSENSKKNEIFKKIVKENRAETNNGIIEMRANAVELFPAVMQMAQVIAKVSNMKYFKREVVENLFYEMLDEFVMTDLARFNPRKDVTPIEQNPEYEVDYELKPNGVPYYVFGVKDSQKARLSTIACQQFSLKSMNFKSIAVYSDIENIGSKDRNRLINASDKQFTNLEAFKFEVIPYIERELRSK